MNEPSEDLYSVLGLGRDAPGREIRRAYRRLARQHHPDHNEQPNGPEQFVRLANAYEVLHDPARRARYDRSLPPAPPPPQPVGLADRPGSAVVVVVCRGILELSPAEAWHVARFPLVLADARGQTIVLPAGTRHGDQITVRDGAHAAILTVLIHKRT